MTVFFFIQSSLSGIFLLTLFPGQNLDPIKSHEGLPAYGVILPYLKYNSRSPFGITDSFGDFAKIEIPRPITAIGLVETSFVLSSMGKPLNLAKSKITPSIRTHV